MQIFFGISIIVVVIDMKSDDKKVITKDKYIPRHAKGRNYTYKNEGKKVMRTKRRVKKWVLNFLLLFFLILIVIGVIHILLWYKDNIDSSQIIKDIISNIDVDEVEDNDDTELIGSQNEDELSDYWYYVKFSLIDVDIRKLKEKNADTVGWIQVNNTNINYPFVQYQNNDYYLNHSFDKSYNEAGWVFLDYRNKSDLSNFNSIIYAHSRLDKTMFGSLSKVLKSDWYSNKDNHIIKISTENENTLWQIFSVYKVKEESYYITTYFKNNQEYINFLDVIQKRSLYDFKVSLTSDDRILTLSTCYSDNVRTVVHAKLIKKSVK